MLHRRLTWPNPNGSRMDPPIPRSLQYPRSHETPRHRELAGLSLVPAPPAHAHGGAAAPGVPGPGAAVEVPAGGEALRGTGMATGLATSRRRRPRHAAGAHRRRPGSARRGNRDPRQRPRGRMPADEGAGLGQGGGEAAAGGGFSIHQTARLRLLPRHPPPPRRASSPLERSHMLSGCCHRGDRSGDKEMGGGVRCEVAGATPGPPAFPGRRWR